MNPVIDNKPFPVFNLLTPDSDNGLMLSNVYIPEEILYHILTFVDPKEILKYCLVCRRWNNMIKSYTLWAKLYKQKYNKKAKQLPWYLYYCLLSTDLFDRNLLQNGNGEDQFENWIITNNGGDRWIVEAVPVGADMLPPSVPEFNNNTSCFATSYGLCSKEQAIKFKQSCLFHHILDCYKPHIYMSEWTAGRFDCGSVYRLRCSFVGINLKHINESSPTVLHNVEQFQGRKWEKVDLLIMQYPEKIKGIIFGHDGCDTQFWAGHYGSKMAGGVVKLLFDSIEPLEVDQEGNPIAKTFTEFKIRSNGQIGNAQSEIPHLYHNPFLRNI